MLINIRYFASLKEVLAKSEDSLETNKHLTAKDVWSELNPNQIMPDNTLVAINKTYATWNEELKSGDEVAFFPPVTGG